MADKPTYEALVQRNKELEEQISDGKLPAKKPSISLLDSLVRCQTKFIQGESHHQVFDGLLNSLLEYTNSEFGFIGEVFHDNDGAAYQLSRAISNFSRIEGAHRRGDGHQQDGIRFESSDSLFGAVMRSGQVVVANNVADDPGARGVPVDHPAIKFFLGIPILHKDRLIGSIGLANRPGGYDPALINELQPFISTCSVIISAIKLSAEREKVAAKLKESEERFRIITENSGDGIALLGGKPIRLKYVNQAMSDIFGYSSDELYAMSIDRFMDILVPEHRAIALKRMQDRLAGKEVARRFEYQVIRKNGDIGWIELYADFIYVGGERFTLAGYRDISERKAAEASLVENEKRYRQIADQIPGILFQYIMHGDGEGSVAFISDKITEFSGITPEQLKNRPSLLFKSIHPDDLAHVHSEMIHSARKFTELNIEHRLMTPDGQTKWFRVRSMPHGLPNGDTFWNGISMDITEQKNAEDVLKANEEQLRTVFEQAAVGICFSDINGRFLKVNPMLCRMTGYSEDALLGIDFREITHPDDLEDEEVRFGSILDGTISQYSRERRYVCKDGHIAWGNHTVSLVRTPDGKPLNFIGIIEDITPRKKAEEELFKAHEFAQNILETSPNLIYIHDLQKQVNIYAHPRMTTVLGYSPEEVRQKGGRLLESILHPDDFSTVAEHHQRMADCPDDQVMEVEYRMMHARGHWITLLSRDMVFARDEQGRGIQIIGSAEDITERKKAVEELLRHQKAISLNNRIANVFLTSSGNDIFGDTLDVILETLESPFGYFGFIDDKGSLNCPSMTRKIWKECDIPNKRIVFPKETWGGLWGGSLINVKTVISNSGLKLPEGHIRLSCAMAVPIVHHSELIGQFVVADKEGGYGPYEKFLLESAASQTAPILNNLLEKEAQEKEHKKMQARIEQAQKMESIGNLAGGIAHDFNNILTPIIGMSEMLLEDLPADGEENENVREILKAGLRGRNLVQQVLAFSRQSEHRLIPVRIQQILKEVLSLSRSTIPSDIEIHQDIRKNCGLVLADPTQIHQIAMNLITNAFHAVESCGGEISVLLTEMVLGPGDFPGSALEPGRYAKMSVTDTGCGIEPHIMDKLFEPYFTTKEQGKGTGLGLAVVFGIVKEHRGEIKVYSEVGKGSTFNVYLPLMEKEENAGDVQKTEEVRTGHEHILLVDDEEPVVRLEKAILERLGYRISWKTGSTEALGAFKSSPEDFDLIITDMTMPVMTGDHLAGEMIAIRPDIPVILCTGFSERINREKAMSMGIQGFLMKPIIKTEMGHMVRNVLDKAKEAEDM